MPTSLSNETVKLLMVGKTGVGKSATANTILGRKTFESKMSTSCITKICQCAFGVQQQQRVEVVDMPGLSDGSLSRERDAQTVLDKAFEAVEHNPDGFHAILMVTALGRFTLEDKQTIAFLKAIFGNEFLKQYGVLVVTHGDLYDPDENDGKTFEEWCLAQNGEFKDLIKECGGRVVLFQNKTKDEDIRAQQLEKLFTLVDEMNILERYTPKVFEVARLEREKVSLELKLPVLAKETERKIDKIFGELELLRSSESADDGKKRSELKEKADRLLQHLQIKDKGTGAFSSVIKMVERVQKAIDAEDQNETLAEVIQLYKNMEKDRQIRKAKIKKRLLVVAAALGIGAAVAAIIVGAVVIVPAIIAAATAPAAAAAAGAASATAAGAATAKAAGAAVAGAATVVAGTATAATATAVAGTATAVTGTAVVTSGSISGVAFFGGPVLVALSVRSLRKKLQLAKKTDRNSCRKQKQ